MAYAQVICLTHGDRTLIERCMRNDAAAFDEVVSRYKNKVYSYVLRMIGGEQDAEDVTQEVFIRMYTSLASFRSQASLNTWLFRIASNLCIDHYRRGKKHQNVTTQWRNSYLISWLNIPIYRTNQRRCRTRYGYLNGVSLWVNR